MIRKSSILLLVISFLGCNSSSNLQQTAVNQPPKPKNVIFMIGDGMGLSQISSTVYTKRKTSFERFTNIGLQKNNSKDELITDSAAAATALARGIKANNNTFGTTEDEKAPPSLIEIYNQKDWNTGIIVTSQITHATPAAYYSYQPSRDMDEFIVLDLLKAKIDFLVGGGKQYFDHRASDDRNLLNEFAQVGYKIETFLEQEGPELYTDCDRYLFLTANDKPLPISNGRLSLIEYVRTGVQFLNLKRDPFFLLIEGSQIDWGGHANNAKYVMDEMEDFDQAIDYVLDFARRDGNTLVIVTADHETGGFSIIEQRKNDLQISFTTKTHTASLIPVFAYGPGAEKFQGVYDNTEIFQKINQLISP